MRTYSIDLQLFRPFRTSLAKTTSFQCGIRSLVASKPVGFQISVRQTTEASQHDTNLHL
jgi:hypothetical protein